MRVCRFRIPSKIHNRYDDPPRNRGVFICLLHRFPKSNIIIYTYFGIGNRVYNLDGSTAGSDSIWMGYRNGHPIFHRNEGHRFHHESSPRCRRFPRITLMYGPSYATYHANCWVEGKTDDEIRAHIAELEIPHNYQWNEVGNASDKHTRIDVLRDILVKRSTEK